MKKFYLLFLILFIFFNKNTFAEMKVSISKDEFKGTTSKYLKSDPVSPNTPLSFPFDKSQATLILLCPSQPYVYFNKVLLKEYPENFEVEFKANEKFLKAYMYQDDNFIKFFNGGSEAVINLMKENDEVWIQFNHYKDGERFYKFNTKGTLDLFNKHCN